MVSTALSVVALVMVTAASAIYFPPNAYQTGLLDNPSDTAAYNEYKKSLYSMNQALGNACFTAQSAFDYYNFYKNMPLTYQSALINKIQKFDNAQDQLQDAYNRHQQLLLSYKASIAYEASAMGLSDSIPINSHLIN